MEEFYQRAYQSEIERKDKLVNSISWPIGFSAPYIASFIAFIKNMEYIPYEIFSLALAALSFIFFISSIIQIHRAIHFPNTSRLPDPAMLAQHFDAIRSSSASDMQDAKISKEIIDFYVEATSKNIMRNDPLADVIDSARKLMLYAFESIGLAFLCTILLEKAAYLKIFGA